MDDNIKYIKVLHEDGYTCIYKFHPKYRREIKIIHSDSPYYNPNALHAYRDYAEVIYKNSVEKVEMLSELEDVFLELI